MQTVAKRLRRSAKRSQRRLENFSSQTEQGIDKYLFSRVGHLVRVRRFTISWLLFVTLLIAALIGQNILLGGYYQTVKAVPGGIYKEGTVGTFTNANPIFATTQADSTVSKLIFAGLFTYDKEGKLVGDLASGYTVDAKGSTYTVKLRPNLTWQDGQRLTSADVLFTYQTIQNPDVQSPLQASWQGIKVSAPSVDTIVFTLPDPLAPFIYNLTNGIIPQHLLKNIPAPDFRSADFNTVHPVGAGPFAMHAIEVSGSDPATAQQQIALVPFKQYHAGQPKLQEFVVHTYASAKNMIHALRQNQLTAIYGLSNVPHELNNDSGILQHTLLLRAATMTFFKTTNPVLADQKVRSALVQAADVPAILKQLDYPTKIVREPLLNGQIGYNPSFAQPNHDQKAAENALTADGWTVNRQGVRTKVNQELQFTLTAADTQEYRKVATLLERQWRTVGADVRTDFQDPTEFKTSLASHNYDALIYGISIGVDPDVFVYWDSSQADVRSAQRLNFSEYKNTTADTSLEAGRTRLDPNLRAIKYKPFLQAWQHDTPALAMYQPRLLYLTNGTVDGLSERAITNPSDRLNNVQNWQIRQARVTDN